jgi:hypothetical protein
MTETTPTIDEKALAEFRAEVSRWGDDADHWSVAYSALRKYLSALGAEPVAKSHWLSHFTADNINHAALDSAVGVLRTGMAAGSTQQALWSAIVDYVDRAHPSPAISDEAVEHGRYLVWSNEHKAWWRADSAGYASSILEAGIYSRADAIDISHGARDGWIAGRRPDEIPVALADIPEPIRAALEDGKV